ncbi:MAG TPA: restriction endonuclease subunit S [Arachnia sp.]|nr:restriction endonuclease subunit S [Arachnia sp.]
MSHIDELIAELAPNGVKFKNLGTVGKWYGGGTPAKTKPEYWSGGTIPWVSPKDMGKWILDSTIDTITEAAIKGSATKLVPPTSIAMVVRSSILDHTFPTALVPMAVALNQDMKAIVPSEDIVPGYLAHLLRSRGPEILRSARKVGGSVASIDSSKLFAFRIPVPPLEVQRVIVRVLDQLTQLEAELAAELKAELEARRSQYEYWRDRLLAFPEAGGGRWIAMSDFGTFIRGRRFTKNDMVSHGIPSIHYGEIYTHFGVSTRETISQVRSDLAASLRYAHPGDVIIAAVGETVEDVAKAVAWLGDTQVAIHDDSFAFRSGQDPRYISYVMQTSAFHAQKEKYVARAKVKRVGSQNLGKIIVPVPPLAEQRRIVAILDNFDALVDDLSVGLHAELATRRKRYEYYHDKLLAFEEAS